MSGKKPVFLELVPPQPSPTGFNVHTDLLELGLRGDIESIDCFVGFVGLSLLLRLDLGRLPLGLSKKLNLDHLSPKTLQKHKVCSTPFVTTYAPKLMPKDLR